MQLNFDDQYDAIIVGSGPNGLAAAIKLAQNDLKVAVLESKSSIGGGTRTLELTEAGFKHDVCSTVHPTALSSPFFKTLPLQQHGLEWVFPDIPVAHPLNNGEAVLARQSLDQTARQFWADGHSYRKIFHYFSENWESLSEDIFSPLRIPSHPFKMMKFGLKGMKSAKSFTDSVFQSEAAKAYFAGLAAHSILPLEHIFSASFGLVLGSSVHAVGWPFAKGGSASITTALANYLKSMGGVVFTSFEVTALEQLPSGIPILFDLTPKQILKIADQKLPDQIKRKLLKYKYGPGSFKMDFALSEPVPWKNSSLQKAGTIHLGSTFEEISESENKVWDGKESENPYVIVTQPSLFDDSRAPQDKHILWAYCHVPHASEADYSSRIIRQIERFAPGFRDTIISFSSMNAPDLELYNANYIGGDINGGAQTFKQLIGRPVFKWDPYKLNEGMYICSSSAPPGGGVHGMCGYHAAISVLNNEFGIT